jgi:methylated-DNA-[protein]-cysteine S-methyltransferase
MLLKTENTGRKSLKQKKGSGDYYQVLESPLGPLYLVFTSGLLSSIEFFKPADIHRKDFSTDAGKELSEYFEKSRHEFTCKTVFLEGTEFEKKVWEALRDIPYGETRTYKWLAEEIGRPNAFRAVGNALGKNPIPIIFPCHRIIEKDGSPGGYSPGLEIKIRLLEIEYYTNLSRQI